MANESTTNLATYTDRSIDKFKSKLVGGGARPNLFECEIYFPDELSLNSEQNSTLSESLRFMVKGSQIPASTLSTIPVAFRGRTLKIAGDRTFDPWTITVINDTNYEIRNAFEKWMNLMNRHDDNAGVITPALYQKEMIVKQLSRGVENEPALPATTDAMPVLKTYKFYGCWPSDISAIDLSYDSSDQIEEFTVTLQYQWWDTFERNESSSMLGISQTI
jgi:hypothetical protein